MTPKQTAFRNTASVVASGILGGVLMSLLFTYFTVYQIGLGFCALVLAFAVKMIYDIELEKAESLKKLNKTVDKRA